MDDLMFAINNTMTTADEAARKQGALTSAAMAKGLASNNPMIRAIAQQQYDVLTAQWQALTGSAYREGVDAATALERGLRTFDSPRFPISGPSRLKGQNYQ